MTNNPNEILFESACCNQFTKFVYYGDRVKTHITRVTDDGLVTKVIDNTTSECVYYKHKKNIFQKVRA